MSRRSVNYDGRIAAHRIALVLARLVTRQAIPIDDLTIHRCLEALGIQHAVLAAAVGEVHRNGWPMPSTQPDRPSQAETELRAALAAELDRDRLAEPAAPAPPTPAAGPGQVPPRANKAGQGYTRTPRQPGEPTTKICPLCPADRAEHPVEDFQRLHRGARVDGSRKMGRDTYCIGCRKALQRTLYLTREKRAQLASVGVTASVTNPDALVCASCGELILPSERAHAVEVLMHQRCAAEVLDVAQGDELEVAS